MSLLSHTPCITTIEAERLARELYALTAVATPLPSERDQNFLLRTDRDERFVLKIANATDDRPFLEAQMAAMERVADRAALCARVVPTTSGEQLTSISWTGGGDGAAPASSPDTHWVRLLTYLEGTPAGMVPHHSSHYRRDLGRAVAMVDTALDGFDHPAVHRTFHWDLARGAEICRAYLPDVTDTGPRDVVERVLAAFASDTAPLLSRLPCSVIHNDANDFNVLVRDDGDPFVHRQRVSGIIDFGDLVHSFTVGDLAIAAAYASLNARDPLAAVCEVVQGYHAVRPLNDDEREALFGLVCLRLATSVCLAAHQRRQRPDDAYLDISQGSIVRVLPLLNAIPPRFALSAIRQACGLEAVRAHRTVERYFDTHRADFAPVLGVPLKPSSTVHVSLAVDSALVSGTPNDNAEPALTARVFDFMARHGATVGFGGYAEARSVYAANAFAEPQAAPGERRTVHLGIDLFAPAGTPVHAPLAGIVSAFARNDRAQDYGPVIILEHATDDGTPFFTLYGHLSVESLGGLHVGQSVAAGDRIATFGTPDVNGGWTPHLHFQVMTDLLDLSTEYPGVARPSNSELWLAFSPNPAALLGIPVGSMPLATPSPTETLRTRRRRMGGNLSVAYRDPVKIVRGSMQYLYDESGRRYIDAYNNVPHVGHAHPRVVEAARVQLSVLNTNTRYLHDAVNRLAEALSATLPPSLSVCYFVNSGSEANELALRLARAHTRRRDVIVLEAAYHGNTTTLIDISPYKHAGPGGEGAPSWVHTVPIPDTYRGAYGRDDPQAGVKYAASVRDVMARLRDQGGGLSAFIAESLPSVGGQIVLPPGYLSHVYAHVRAGGGVCIADEVQTGYGRIGSHFWGFASQDVVPDIVVIGKPIGNGYPLGAVVTTPEIAASFDNGMEYFSTFGGSTVSSVVGLEVLQVVHDESLPAHAQRVGAQMLAQLTPFVDRFAAVGDVRGSGLFLGVELVRDRTTRAPDSELATYVVNRMREEGILLGTDGPWHNVVKIRPPMPFGMEDASELVACLERVLDGVGNR